jgi:hypothetical protein
MGSSYEGRARKTWTIFNNNNNNNNNNNKY